MNRSSSAGSVKLLYAATAALSAFLLFSIEPMIARALLPLLGGSSAVWISALAFFQLDLLLGYAYTAVVAKASIRRPGLLILHLGLIWLAAASVFVAPIRHLRPGGDLAPQLRLFVLLSRSIGLPFFVLSTSAPLLQAWYARRERAAVPYRLFALSNLSSLLALLAYPLLVEPHLELHTQKATWNAAFAVYAVLITFLTLRMRSAVPGNHPAPMLDAPASATTPASSPQPGETTRRLLWFALPAIAAMQLAAVTAHLSQDVAAMPLLWVLPLAAYLLSFVLAFELPRLYDRALVLKILAVLLLSLGYFLAQTGFNLPIGLSILFFVAELLIAAWFLHAELYALRPAASSASTVFYLQIAAGGAAGTVFVAILSPLLTRSNFDLPISFLLTAVLAAAVTWRSLGQRLFWAACAALGVLLLFTLHNDYEHDALLRARNFYGSITVKQTELPPQAVTSRLLFNGSIQHGMQWFSQDFRHTPLTYYEPDSGVGLALEHCCSGPRRIGVIGLGAGTLAAYGRAGDTVRFYEINPLVITVAKNLFTYTRETPANVTVMPGDARLTLSAEPSQRFDVLVVDAFSGDSIPTHLLTREALDLYRRQLAPGGIIAFHISNQYLDLAPVLGRLAASTEHQPGSPLVARRIDTDPDEDRGELRASWVLMTDRPALFNDPAFSRAQPVSTQPNVALWTDQYSSLLPIVRWSGRDRPAK